MALVTFVALVTATAATARRRSNAIFQTFHFELAGTHRCISQKESVKKPGKFHDNWLPKPVNNPSYRELPNWQSLRQ